MNKLLIALLFVSASLAPALAPGVVFGADEGFSSLEEQMTGQDFKAAGLDKLTPQELESLNGWIRRRSLATLDAPVPAAAAGVATATEDSPAAADSQVADRRGFKGEDEERTPISSRIVGRFSGWDGQTVFRLENGMIWAQADKDKFYMKEVENPAIVIDPGMFGSWRLSVEGQDAECRVERIQ
jgi:hypothetical protein